MSTSQRWSTRRARSSTRRACRHGCGLPRAPRLDARLRRGRKGRRGGHGRLRRRTRPASGGRGRLGRRGQPAQPPGPPAPGKVRHGRRRGGRSSCPQRGGDRSAEDPRRHRRVDPGAACRLHLGQEQPDARRSADPGPDRDGARRASSRPRAACDCRASGTLARLQCAGDVGDPLVGTKLALRTLARRYEALSTEMAELESSLDRLTARANPALRGAKGVGTDVAAILSPRRATTPSG
jgi:hypothetical protein